MVLIKVYKIGTSTNTYNTSNQVHACKNSNLKMKNKRRKRKQAGGWKQKREKKLKMAMLIVFSRRIILCMKWKEKKTIRTT